MKRITLDTNIWPSILVSQQFSSVREAIRKRTLLACVPETIFTLEAIKKTDRKGFFANYKPIVSHEETVMSNGAVKISISIGPDKSIHPGNNNKLSECMAEALGLGFKVLRCAGRIGGLVNPDLKEAFYMEDIFVNIAGRQKVFLECLKKIEAKGCGIKQLKDIGAKYDKKFWLDGISLAPQKDWKLISTAVAEWADGDAIAAHIAYKNEFFCTRDEAKKSGSNSILSEKNKK